MMNRLILLALLLCCCSVPVFAQQKLIEPLINAWKVDDTSQTHRAEVGYAQLKLQKENRKANLPQHLHLMKALHAYVGQNSDDRLKVRLTMYEILGKFELGLKILPQDSTNIYDCIKLAHKLKDDQLKAEVYTLCAEVGKGTNRYVLYNLKAIELERKVGFSHFKYVHNRFFNVSLGLYQSNNYRKSIDYGLQCLAFKNVRKDTWDPRVYIFQLDIIGASYLKLNQYDSARYYYQQIIDTLTKTPDENANVQSLWLGIAKGNIGHALILQGKEAQGTPLVYLQLQNSTAIKSYNNMAIAQNILANLDFKHKRYQEAVSKWKQAYHWALQSEYYVVEQKLLSLKGIVMCYRKLQVPDSAYKYGDLYNRLNNERLLELGAQQLSAIKAKIEFDDIQTNLENISTKLRQEKMTRNFILGGIFLLAVISLLLYNRQKLKVKHETEILNRDRMAKDLEIKEARERINSFALNMGQKEKLIRNLERTIKANGTDNLSSSLLNYVLVTDEEWHKFKEAFSKAYPLFFPRLKQIVAHLNPAEERLASLICLDLNNQQIANMLGISASSVARSKRRLKQRIAVPEGQSIESYICDLNDLV
ncbi:MULTISPECIES: hypothetical protein [unclassified Pedobacter]|uniref:hypothetical protein n=1 Tax=unclassified Pedobacter TaxID=2628915 RepID=UPI00180EF784|nr:MULTISPECIES: hypothetical protein [unclassified Pedobacter]NII84283.1 hypothetical protein [Pedobacter sp. SG908]NMN38801.1 hypothetical protein [Pedobacter sp. SG918]